MTYDPMTDGRLDPRVRAVLSVMPVPEPLPHFASREAMVEAAQSAEAIAGAELSKAIMDGLGGEEIAPSTGLRVETHQVISAPDGNVINILYTRPDDDATLPCVYYVHGGGMATMSCYWGNYTAFARLLAHHGVAVAMVDFRNSLMPSSVPEVAPYPAGLNDVVSGVKWVSANASLLGIDPTRLVVAGESGGGNLTLATGMKLLREGDVDLISGLYALAPFIAGEWPRAEFPSSVENEGIFISLHDAQAALLYGQDAFDAKDPLAWPSFATTSDVAGLPPVVINVNECDPLRDEGIAFYRLLTASGVPARCRQVMGTFHAVELGPSICPEITLDVVRDIAGFTQESARVS
jgi:acetyl esterase